MRILLSALGILFLVASGCSESGPACPDVPSAAGPGTFAFRVERASECYVVRGERASSGTVPSVYTGDDLFLGNLTVDAEGDEGALSLLFEVVAVGDLPAGTYEVADLFEAPAIDVPVPTPRLVEHPGRVSFAAYLDRQPVWSRGGTVRVERPAAGLAEVRVEADMETAAGEAIRVEGEAVLQPGEVIYTLIQ